MRAASKRHRCLAHLAISVIDRSPPKVIEGTDVVLNTLRYITLHLVGLRPLLHTMGRSTGRDPPPYLFSGLRENCI